MPTYEYRCPNGHDFERFYRSISAAQGEAACPQCGLIGERRLSAGAGLLFKGSGFYITDYGKDGKKDQRTPAKADAKSDGGAPAAGGAPAGSGDGGNSAAAPAAESKPAAEAKPAPAPPKSSGSGSAE